MNLRLDETGFGSLKIFQNPEEFCYGVDAVLLAGFAAEAAAKKRRQCKIMDLGTGTGIVPLILSHKTEADFIGGIEVQKNSWQIAVKNAEYNNLTDRLRFFHSDVKGFGRGNGKGTFDVVTSNPPYTAGAGGIESSNKAKSIARHETTASLDDFVRTASVLLRDKGDFYMVHRPTRLVDLCTSCRRHHLEPKELCFVSGKPFEKSNIILIHCTKYGNPELRILDPLFVHNEDGSYSQEILKLYEKLP